MKKLTLFLVAMLFSALSFALNPFAYGLSSSLDGTTLKVNYSLNALATAVSVVIMDGETEVKTVTCDGITKGSYTVDVSTVDLPIGKSLTWKVVVNGTKVDKPTQESTQYSFWGPRGLAIDTNPESEYFGRILVTESYHPVKDLANYQSSEKGAGIYVFKPDFTTEGNVENGGLDFTNVLAPKTGFMPWRVKISDDGRIFVSSLDKNGVVVWEVSKDLKTWTPVIFGTNDNTDYNIYDANGDFFAGLNVAMDVQGSGENLKLLLYSANKTGIAISQAGYRLDEYALGTATTFTGKPQNIITGGDFGFVHTDVDFIYDGEGGYWFGGSRAGSDGTPSLVHINSEGVEDLRDETATYYGGGGVLIHKGLLFKGKARSSTSNGKFGIYTIGKKDGKTTLTQKWEVISTGLGRNHNQFAVDFAENLYVIGNSQEKIQAYTLPYSGTVETPCASKYAFTLDANSASASELNPFAYDLSSTWNSTSKTLTVNYSLNANATGVDIVIMDGKMEVKRVACSGKTRGTHTEVISAEGLSMNRKFTWKVDVKGTSKSVPTKVSTMYSLWGPYGLAIDTDPNSEYFGRILATESRHNVTPSNASTDYISKGTDGLIKAGLYVFNPAFGTDRKVITGGVNFTRNATLNKGFQPFRVRISDDGRIFVTSLDINGVVVWEVSKDLKTWTPLFSGTHNSSDYWIYNNSAFFAGPNASIDVTGTGDDLKLLLYSVGKDGFAAAPKGYRLEEYTMSGVETGEAFPKTGTHKAIKEFNGYNVTLNDANPKRYKYGCAYNQSAVIYDGEGGYWFAGSRGNNVSTEPNLAHVSASGVQDYYNTSDALLGGAGLLIHDHSTVGKVLIKGTKPSGTFKIYLLEKNADGTPKLTEKWTVTSGIGTNHNAFAIDYAENLYTIGNSGEKIAAFALPYDGEVSTPAMDKYSFTIYAGYTPAATDQLNPFAYALSSELIDGGMNLKVNYKLNATANSAKVVIMNGTTEVKTVDCTELTKGTHTLTIPTEGLPTNTDLTWKVVVNGTSVTKVQEYSTKHSLSYPSAIDIDNNPNNETFGNILVVEALHASKEQIGLLSSNYGSGIFAFDATFANISKYNGNNVFTTGRTDANGSRAYAPHRLRISDDGRIFVTSLNTNGDVLWEVNPNDMNSWTPIFTGLTQDANKDLVNGSTFVAGPNAGFDVRGSGENLQLLMLSANTVSYSFGQTGFRVSEYNLGGNTSWNTAPSKAFPHENFLRSGVNRCYFISATGSQVQYDKDGGVWYIQNRAECTETMPGLVYFDRNGNEKYKAVRNDTRNAGFRFNHDFTKVAISDNTFVNIYSITKDPSGVPILTQELGIKLSSVGNNILDFVWDYANNLYVTGSTLSSGVYKGNAVAYRLPYSGEVTTPAASKYTFRVEYEVTVDENADNTTALTSFEGKTVTAKVVRNFTNNNYMTLTLPFDMNVAQVNQAFGSGNATIYTFAYTQKDAEGTLELHFNTTTSIQAGHPYILKLKNAVNGFEVDGVTISTALTDNVQDGITMQPVLDAGGTLSGATQYWLASDNYLYHAQTYSTAILGLRAIFDIPAGSRVRARAVFNSNETTDVVDLTPDQTTTPTVKKVLHKGQLIIIRGEEKYTIQGQRME